MKLNITSKLLSLLVMASLILTSCGDDKDDDVTPDVGQTSCRLTKVSDDDSDESVIEYNAKGYVSKVTETDSEDGTEYTVVFTYDSNNNLVKEESFEDGESDGYYTYEYSNGMLSKIKSYSGGELNYTETLTYDSNKKITKISDDEGYVMNFTYSGNNVSEATVGYMDEISYKIKYENYDNKLTPYAAIKGMVNPYSGSSQNNPGKVTYSYYYEGEEAETAVINYTYQYNDKNLPTKITEVDGDDTYVTNFTYACN
ncbi:hypothetical protein H7F15_14640 [Pontibacter sp. Tf4]|uniref:hypothetical protein n=1 Tax=Pontibacter sp. Tf4 TaxID=2761620 RepID=UPI0016263B06|nr:hypothetical protein [Pontibacter sp. Tf4]MBB6612285.1 hypothetical protein [Pontibacter sp. Tf4]